MQDIQYFPGQKEDEKIVLILRKHWIVKFNVALFLLIFGIVPLVVSIFLMTGFWDTLQSQTARIVIIFFIEYFLFIFLISYIKWLNEELDIVIITNQRIINVNQVKFLSREISETSLSLIQDVKGRAAGLLSTLFDYGHIEVQTAADKILFCMNCVPKPMGHIRKILDLKDEHIKSIERTSMPPDSSSPSSPHP